MVEKIWAILHSIDYKWIIAILIAVISIFYVKKNYDKRLSNEADKDKLKLIIELIHLLDKSILYFSRVEINNDNVSLYNWSGNIFQISNSKDTYPYGILIYTSPKLYFNHGFINYSSKSILPDRISKILKKFGKWEIAFTKESQLEKFIIAGTESPIPYPYGIAEIYMSAKFESWKKDCYFLKSDKQFTVKFNGDYKYYKKLCRKLVFEIKRWLKNHNIKDINYSIFQQ